MDGWMKSRRDGCPDQLDVATGVGRCIEYKDRCATFSLAHPAVVLAVDDLMTSG